MNKGIDYLIKTFTASMPINQYDDTRLKLVVYGTAYVEVMHLKKYNVIQIEEMFTNNPKSMCRTLFVRITLEEQEINIKELN